MLRYLAPMAILASCSSYVPTCQTKCGVISGDAPYPLPAGWTCERVQKSEDIALQAFSTTGALDPVRACASFRDTLLVVLTTELDKQGNAGVTSCWDFHVINVGISGAAYVHEMIHMATNCYTGKPRPEDRGDTMHAGWHELGYWHTIDIAVAPLKKLEVQP